MKHEILNITITVLLNKTIANNEDNIHLFRVQNLEHYDNNTHYITFNGKH